MTEQWQQDTNAGVTESVPWIDRDKRVRYRVRGPGAKSGVTYSTLAQASKVVAAQCAKHGVSADAFRVTAEFY